MLVEATVVKKEQGASACVKSLEELLYDLDPQIRAGSAHALGQLGDIAKETLPDLMAALEDARVARRLTELGPGDVPLPFRL